MKTADMLVCGLLLLCWFVVFVVLVVFVVFVVLVGLGCCVCGLLMCLNYENLCCMLCVSVVRAFLFVHKAQHSAVSCCDLSPANQKIHKM